MVKSNSIEKAANKYDVNKDKRIIDVVVSKLN